MSVLYSIPVVLTYRLERHQTAALYSLHVDAVASNSAAALAVARVMVRHLCAMRDPHRQPLIADSRTRIGQPSHSVTGPYAYIIGTSNRIPHLSFPARLDNDSAIEMSAALKGIDPHLTYGVVLDCAPMQFIATSALAALGEHHRRLRLHLCRVPPAITKVLEIVGMDRLLNIHPDMRSALDALSARIARRRSHV